MGGPRQPEGESSVALTPLPVGRERFLQHCWLAETGIIEAIVNESSRFAQCGCRGSGPIVEQTIQSGTGRQWKVVGTG
jgi:hypothetical protein